MERKTLGKGLEALISSAGLKNVEKEEKAVYLKITDIKPNPYQPRQEFDEESLKELCDSIQKKGIIQPVIVRRRAEGSYELIAGERRLRAAKLLNLNEIPAIIRDVSDAESLELSLIENLQRQNLNPIEEANAFQYLINKFGLTQEEVAQVVGKSRVSVTNILRLLKLPLEIQEEIKKGRLSFAHGRLLLEIADPQKQKILAQKIIANSLTIKELENLIHNMPTVKSKPKKSLVNPSSLSMVREELQRILGTKVQIVQGRTKGCIQIEFYSLEDLKRLLEFFKK